MCPKNTTMTNPGGRKGSRASHACGTKAATLTRIWHSQVLQQTPPPFVGGWMWFTEFGARWLRARLQNQLLNKQNVDLFWEAHCYRHPALWTISLPHKAYATHHL